MKIKKLSKKFVVIILAVLVLVVSGSIWTVAAKDDNPTTSIKESTATRGDIDVYIEADGIVSAEKANVNFSQAGVLRSIAVKVGDRVANGDILASLEASKLQNQVDQARAVYSANIAKANRLKPGSGEEILVKERAVDAARSALVAETSIYNDVVARSGAGSSQELTEYAKLSKAESDVVTAEAQLSLTAATYSDAQYTVSSSYASLDSAQQALAEANLRSPIDGIVTSVNGVIGQSTGGTQQASTSLITISKIDNLSLVSNLDEEDIAKVKIDQVVEAEFASLGKTVSGSVIYVSPVAKIDANGSVTYEVKIGFDKDGANIIDGMSANIKFITKSVNNVVRIPNKAVTMVDRKSIISYYGTSKEILTKVVVTGFTDGQYVEVVSGLGAGEKYILTETK